MSLMPANGTTMPPTPIEDQVAPQDRGGPGRAVAHAAEGERDQRDDDERVEDHAGEDRRLAASGAA